MTPAALASAIRAAATDDLIGDDSFRRIEHVAGIVPTLRGGVSLELHLGLGQERADLLARAMHLDAPTLAQTVAPELAQARRFSAWWDAAPGADRVRYVDLEFDMDRSTPGCFVGPMIEPTLPEGMKVVLESFRTEGVGAARFEFAVKVLEAPDDEPFAGCPEAALRRCFEALPLEGFIGHAGSLRFRMRDGSPLVRLIPSLRRSDLASYLQRIEWPGDLAALEDAAERYLGAAARIDVDLDVRAFGLAPEAAFCRTFWDGGLVPGPLHEALDRLRADDLITPRQANGVTAFADSDLWYPEFPRTITLKIKVAGDGRRTAKVYLSMLRVD